VKKNKIVLFGTGKVASHIGTALLKSGQNILQVYGRDKVKTKNLADQLNAVPIRKFEALDPAADLLLLAVKDDALTSIISGLDAGGAVVAHTSGTVNISGAGVLYPLQTFSQGRNVDLSKVPFFVHADDIVTEELLLELAAAIGSKAVKMDNDQRKLLHLCAVFVNNFSNHMMTLAKHLLDRENLSWDYLQPLIEETFAKLREMDPEKSQTGPARRNDIEVLAAHQHLLESMYPEGKELYEVISKSIQQYHKGD